MAENNRIIKQNECQQRSEDLSFIKRNGYVNSSKIKQVIPGSKHSSSLIISHF